MNDLLKSLKMLSCNLYFDTSLSARSLQSCHAMCRLNKTQASLALDRFLFDAQEKALSI